MSYYEGKEAVLADLFGVDQVEVRRECVVLDGRKYDVVDDVIICLDADRLPPSLTSRRRAVQRRDFADDIQFTFGEEWNKHREVMPEHEGEFAAYFDLVDLEGLADSRVGDLGCGSGRWAHFMAPHCRQLVVVDFSDAIFVARQNLRAHDHVVFVLADVLDLPFRMGAFDFAYCLGVLHHTPMDALDATRNLRGLSPRLLVYLYYALDNRPAHFRLILGLVTAARLLLARVRSRRVRGAVAWMVAVLVYLPLSRAGRLLGRHGHVVPLTDTYADKSLPRIRQDVYDRFFTRIEQRVTRSEVEGLADTFETVVVSEALPYWHFLCSTNPA